MPLFPQVRSFVGKVIKTTAYKIRRLEKNADICKACSLLQINCSFFYFWPCASYLVVSNLLSFQCANCSPHALDGILDFVLLQQGLKLHVAKGFLLLTFFAVVENF